jgi:hypothetical protein
LQGFAACVTVKLRPAIVSVPVRCDASGFIAAENATVPFPVPLAPLVIVNQLAPLVAVQLQPAAPVTADVPVPPPNATDWLVGEMLTLQLPAAWFTVKVRPAIVRVPLRADDVGFAAPLNPTVPLPDPLAPLVTVSQPALLVAAQAQPANAVTVLEPVPPAAAIDWLVGEIVNVQPRPA